MPDKGKAVDHREIGKPVQKTQPKGGDLTRTLYEAQNRTNKQKDSSSSHRMDSTQDTSPKSPEVKNFTEEITLVTEQYKQDISSKHGWISEQVKKDGKLYTQLIQAMRDFTNDNDIKEAMKIYGEIKGVYDGYRKEVNQSNETHSSAIESGSHQILEICNESSYSLQKKQQEIAKVKKKVEASIKTYGEALLLAQEDLTRDLSKVQAILDRKQVARSSQNEI